VIPSYINQEVLHSFLTNAYKEDLGDGDHSTLASVSTNTTSSAVLVSKDVGIIAGLELSKSVFNFFDSTLEVTFFKSDGDPINQGDKIYEIKGSARSILTTERLALNCIQRMSGIATKTAHLVTLISGTNAKLLDTRKTTPNFRLAEKWAVAIGGGTNHRFGLFDLVMLKDNHIAYAGGFRNAIRNTKAYLKNAQKDLKIEVETTSFEEVRQVVEEGGIDIIMLDNMDLSETRRCVDFIAGKYTTEASGGITEETIRQVAETGVDFISVGALTHSYRSLDLSLKADI
jgi:nicotinate-nucleotide pyrophosphorylase (carboxylating)